MLEINQAPPSNKMVKVLYLNPSQAQPVQLLVHCPCDNMTFAFAIFRSTDKALGTFCICMSPVLLSIDFKDLCVFRLNL